MIVEERGRTIVRCDRCVARLDLGPARKFAHTRVRMPSGWVETEPGKHQCSLHAVEINNLERQSARTFGCGAEVPVPRVSGTRPAAAPGPSSLSPTEGTHDDA